MSAATTSTIPTTDRKIARLKAKADREARKSASKLTKWDAYYESVMANTEHASRTAQREYENKALKHPEKRGIYEAKMEVINTDLQGYRLRAKSRKIRHIGPADASLAGQIATNKAQRRIDMKALREAKKSHRKTHGFFRRVGRGIKNFFVGVKDKVLAPIGRFVVKFVAKPVWFALKVVGANALVLLFTISCLFILGMLIVATPFFFGGLGVYLIVAGVIYLIHSAITGRTVRTVTVAAAA